MEKKPFHSYISRPERKSDPGVKQHRWSGFPGAYCLDCGEECQAEICLAQNFPECLQALDSLGLPDPSKCAIHGKAHPCMPNNPVHQWEGKWWFWDETWSNRVGPYEDATKAREGMELYVKLFLDKPAPIPPPWEQMK